MNPHFEIRLIKPSDTAAVLEVYKPYILNTSITFEYEVPTVEAFSERIETITIEYPWLACLRNAEIIGFAYGCKHRYRTAYNWSVESTIYLSPEFHEKGIGRILYQTLFAILQLQGFFNVYAGIAMPNAKSEGFHEKMGFEKIGDFSKIGYKFGRWHDVKWYQKHLGEHGINPKMPKTMDEIIGASLKQIILSSNESIRSRAF